MAITLQPSDLIFEFASNGMDDIHQVWPQRQSLMSQGRRSEGHRQAGRQPVSQPAGRLASQQILIKYLPTRFRVLGLHASQTVCQLVTHVASE